MEVIVTTVDGSEIRRFHQLRLEVYFSHYVIRVWDTSQVVVWDFSS